MIGPGASSGEFKYSRSDSLNISLRSRGLCGNDSGFNFPNSISPSQDTQAEAGPMIQSAGDWPGQVTV